MAVFPKKIVLKNSSDPQATITAAIASGASDEIQVGELVIGTETGNVKIYTVDAAGNVVSLGTTTEAQCIVSSTEPTVTDAGAALQDGHMWFNSTTDEFSVYYSSAWVLVSAGGSGGGLAYWGGGDFDTGTSDGEPADGGSFD